MTNKNAYQSACLNITTGMEKSVSLDIIGKSRVSVDGPY